MNNFFKKIFNNYYINLQNSHSRYAQKVKDNITGSAFRKTMDIYNNIDIISFDGTFLCAKTYDEDGEFNFKINIEKYLKRRIANKQKALEELRMKTFDIHPDFNFWSEEFQDKYMSEHNKRKKGVESYIKKHTEELEELEEFTEEFNIYKGEEYASSC